MKEIGVRATGLIGLSLALAISPAVAQSRSPESAASSTYGQDEEQPLPRQQRQTPLETNPSGRIARSSIGEIGQRQTRDATAQQTGIKPTARIANRIQNRVQNRIRNRIDQNYNPQANANDPFLVAEDQARTIGPPR